MATIQAGISGEYDGAEGIETKDDWYASREQAAGGTVNPWSERADFGQGEDQLASTYDPTFSVSGPLTQDGLIVDEAYTPFGTTDNQALYGQTGGGSPQAYAGAAPDANDQDGTWEADGITGPLTGSTPGSNPFSGSIDAGKATFQPVSLGDLAS